MIEVLAGGALSSLQDLGRTGLRHLGVPRAGVLSPPWMRIANALVDNALETPVIECFEGGLRLRSAERELFVAHAGDADVVAVREGTRVPLAPWRTHRLAAGTELAVRGTGRARLAVIAVRGLAVPVTLGSASTYARAGIGGTRGRALAAGDELALEGGDSDARDGRLLCCEPFAAPLDEPVLHAVSGPQQDAFEAAELERFFAASWTLSGEADRMGARLDGPRLRHRDAASRDIVSDAIVPGSVQVPGSGQPIVMLADAHTAGGYPKIATVVSADLPLLGTHRAGTPLRLVRVDVEAAVRHTRARASALDDHLGTLRPAPAESPDTARLLATNLIDGVTDGRAEPDGADA